MIGRLAQLVRAPALHAGSRGFESLIAQFFEWVDPDLGRFSLRVQRSLLDAVVGRGSFRFAVVPSVLAKETVAIMAQGILDRKIGPIPPSGLGPDGKLRVMTEEEHREYIESALRRIDAIEEIPDDPNDPPEEEWMRAIDELRPHRPVFKGCY